MNLDALIDRDDLYYTVFPGGWSFTYRLLTLKEYRRFDALRSTRQFHNHYLHWKVFERCLDGDKDFISQKMPMGIPISIGALIMYLSGDCEVDTVQEQITETRALYNGGDLMEKLKRIILLAFPNYTPKELDQLNRVALIRCFVEAEAMLIEKYGDAYKPLDVSKIVPISSIQETEDKRRTSINFDEDNVSIKAQLHPYDEIDRIEKEFAQEQEVKKKQKPTRLTKEQIAKLDALQKR